MVRLTERISAALEKLASYEDAEEQGRLVRLPCKIGDTVYLLVDGKITEWEVEAIEIRTFYESVGLKRGRGGSLQKTYVLLSLWNEIAFSTREEAEAALQKLNAAQQTDVGEWRKSGDGFFDFCYRRGN